jgi:UDP-N-acetylmuramyl pentapeptide synthase
MRDWTPRRVAEAAVTFSGRRGERLRLRDGVTVIDDCYNANPMSMRDDAAAAALIPGLLRPGDTVLVKGSRGIGLEAVTQALAHGADAED